MKPEKEELYFENSEQWRQWLWANHSKAEGVYLIFYRVGSDMPSMRWEEAVQEALCFGWIDSTVKRLDEQRRKQLFTPRKAKSTWSKVNKQYIEVLSQQGRIHEAGRAKVEIAKANGSWTHLDQVEDCIVPDDLQEAFNNAPDAYANYQTFTRTYQKSYLYWLNEAKRTETRQKRIGEIIANCLANKKSRQES